MSRRGLLTGAILLVLIAGGVGVSIGAFVRPDRLPNVVVEPTGSTQLPVEIRVFDDARSMQVIPSISPSESLTLASEGVVTRSNCKPGASLKSGASPFAINGDAIVALNLDTPPWRSLQIGVKGEDVTAFQRALASHGYAIEVTGIYDSQTVAAVREFWRSYGVASRADVPRESLMWLARKSVKVSQCAVAVGDSITTGQEVAVIGGRLKQLEVVIPTEARPAGRVAEVGDMQATFDDDSIVTNKDFLDEFAQSADFARWRSDNTSTLTVSTKLVSPAEVVAVPPSALYDVRDATACVVSDGHPIRVTIVASELGNTLVTSSPLPRTVTVPAPSGNPECE